MLSFCLSSGPYATAPGSVCKRFVKAESFQMRLNEPLDVGRLRASSSKRPIVRLPFTRTSVGTSLTRKGRGGLRVFVDVDAVI